MKLENASSGSHGTPHSSKATVAGDRLQPSHYRRPLGFPGKGDPDGQKMCD